LFVEKHRVEELDEPVDVYNFQVEDYHTYFVGESAVWVHNDRCPVPEPRKSEKNGLTYKSNPKHTRGQPGNRPNAGIEPRNSFELFENSRVSTMGKGRYKNQQRLFIAFSVMLKELNGIGVVQLIKVLILYVQ